MTTIDVAHLLLRSMQFSDGRPLLQQFNQGENMESTTSHDAKRYNALLPIADANRVLCASGEDATVGRLLAVIRRYGMEDKLGIRLLHKHNDLHGGEVMFESSLYDEEGFALATKAVPSGASSMVPNSWQLVDDTYVPVEYSDPRLVNDSDIDLTQYSELLDELSVVLKQTGTVGLLGPCLHYSLYVEELSPFARSAFLEKTDFEDRANIVRFVDLTDPAFSNSAKTKWKAVQAVDSQGNKVWTTACNCFCSVFPQGGHQGTTTHRYTP